MSFLTQYVCYRVVLMCSALILSAAMCSSVTKEKLWFVYISWILAPLSFLWLAAMSDWSAILQQSYHLQVTVASTSAALQAHYRKVSSLQSSSSNQRSVTGSHAG